MTRTIRVLRVFTRDGDGGNPLGVHDGLLDDDEMQAIAAELGYSETVFLGEPVGGVTPSRIFTPTYEMPFAGHPLVGATWHAAAPDESVSLDCQIGTVTGRRTGRDRASIDVTFLPTVVDVDAPDGVESAWVARMPLEYEMHRLSDPDAVASYHTSERPDHRYVWALGEDGHGDVVRARFFAAGVGVDEDPATGSAAVALSAVFRHVGDESGSVTIHQGADMGVPCRIDLAWTPALTTIGGAVVDDGTRTV
jgi:predicted PhzF superfamily epimerase YddE/YHI9